MKRLFASAFVALSFLGASVATAATDDTNIEQSHVLPVLVAVNADGKVVKVDPAIRLRAKQMKALKQAVNTMITKPAMKDGHGVYSQFILQLALSPDTSGNGGTVFTYVSARPAPPGPVHWAVERDHGRNKFALAQPQSFQTQLNQGLPSLVRPSPAPPSNPGRK